MHRVYLYECGLKAHVPVGVGVIRTGYTRRDPIARPT